MKVYFVLSGPGGELDRHEAGEMDTNHGYTKHMIAWLEKNRTVLEPGDTITIEEVE
jgi:hypothetical protein